MLEFDNIDIGVLCIEDIFVDDLELVVFEVEVEIVLKINVFVVIVFVFGCLFSLFVVFFGYIVFV